jgi:hypothetical protein
MAIQLGPQWKKDWWAPVWRGLVMDQEAKHYRGMKNAVWLYLYLLLNANRITGVLMRKTRTISSDMGVSRDMVIRWLNLLRQQGYVATQSSGRYLTIRVNNWKSLPKPNNGRYGRIQPQVSEISNSSRWKNPTSLLPDDSPIPDYFGPKSASYPQPKETERKKILNNETVNMEYTTAQHADDGAFKSIGFLARHELLAQEVAQALSDADGIGLYRTLCRRYPEHVVRRALSEATAVPDSAVKKGRRQLFTYLLHHYAKGTTENPGG